MYQCDFPKESNNVYVLASHLTFDDIFFIWWYFYMNEFYNIVQGYPVFIYMTNDFWNLKQFYLIF